MPKKDQIKELTNSLQRLQAEFENFKKRTEKENLEYKKCAIQDFIIKLLPILDNFELALKHNQDNKEFVLGVELIYSELNSLLQEEGLEKIEALNKKFDPHIHEALLTEESDKPNIILEELQKGYMLNDKILRHTKVKVSKEAKKCQK